MKVVERIVRHTLQHRFAAYRRKIGVDRANGKDF